MMFVEARVMRRKRPVTLEPKVVREKEEMLAELRGVREQTLAFIEETRGRDLSKYKDGASVSGKPERVSVAPIPRRA